MTLKENLKIIFNKVYSHDVHVATIWFEQLIVKPGNWNQETKNHINHAALKLNLKLVWSKTL